MFTRRFFVFLLLLAFLATFALPATSFASTAQPVIKIVKLTSPVKRNANAKLVIQTGLPGAQCNLVYKMPSGNYSTAKGLGNKTADKKGLCTWKWKIGSNTRTGTGQLIITVNKTTTLRKPIVIK